MRGGERAENVPGNKERSKSSPADKPKGFREIATTQEKGGVKKNKKKSLSNGGEKSNV